MRIVPLALIALGLISGCLVPIGEMNEERTALGDAAAQAGGSGGIITSGWDAWAPNTGGSIGKTDAGPADGQKPDAPSGPCSALMGFADDFGDNTPAPFWLPAADGNATWEESEGALRVSLPTTISINTFGGYRLEQGFDLEGCSLAVHLSQVPQWGMLVYTHFWLSYGALGYAEFWQAGEGLYFQYWQSGTVQLLDAAPFNPNVQVYWRFAHDGVNLRWETSANGTNWTLNASAPLPATFSALRIGAGGTTTKQVSGGLTAVFDELVVAPVQP